MRTSAIPMPLASTAQPALSEVLLTAGACGKEGLDSVHKATVEWLSVYLFCFKGSSWLWGVDVENGPTCDLAVLRRPQILASVCQLHLISAHIAEAWRPTPSAQLRRQRLQDEYLQLLRCSSGRRCQRYVRSVGFVSVSATSALIPSICHVRVVLNPPLLT